VKIAMIDLGEMGANMAERLVRTGHEVVGFDLNAGAVAAVETVGADGATSLEDVSAPVIVLSLMGRIESRDEIEFADRLLASMRKGFGGHAVITEDETSNE
jgi:6-phosphogluconate dehydrogenase (decarboxylating)